MEGKLWRTVRLRDMARAAARFAKLPTLGVGAALLSNAGRFAPALLVAVLYGAQVAGWFALAQRILAAPVYVSSNAVARVYLSEAPRRARAEGTGIYKLFKTTTWRLLAFGVLALGLLIIAGPQLFGLIFGPVWTEAGRYAQFLALVTLGQLVVGPISQTLTVLERQDLQLGCGCLALCCAVASVSRCASAGLVAAYDHCRAQCCHDLVPRSAFRVDAPGAPRACARAPEWGRH